MKLGILTEILGSCGVVLPARAARRAEYARLVVSDGMFRASIFPELAPIVRALLEGGVSFEDDQLVCATSTKINGVVLTPDNRAS